MLSVSVSLKMNEDGFRQPLAALTTNCAGAPKYGSGCLQFDSGRDGDRPDVFHRYEVCRDEAAAHEWSALPAVAAGRRRHSGGAGSYGQDERPDRLGGDKAKEVSP